MTGIYDGSTGFAIDSCGWRPQPDGTYRRKWRVEQRGTFLAEFATESNQSTDALNTWLIIRNELS